MKKYFYATILMVFACFSQAQTIPNGSFEDWTTGTNALPLNWTSGGMIAKLSTLQINTQSGNLVRYPRNGTTFIGLGNAQISGTVVLGQVGQKFPLTSRPKSIRFDCMYFAAATPTGQSAGVQILMTKKNGTITDTIAFGSLTLNGATISDWASVNFDIDQFYKSGVTSNPDSCYIRFICLPNSSSQVSVGALSFILDAAKFSDRSASVEDNYSNFGKPKSLELLPNPTNNKTTLSFNMSYQSKIEIDILNMNGQIIKQIETIDAFTGNNKIDIDVSDLEKGTYIVKVTSDKGVNSKRLIVTE